MFQDIKELLPTENFW